MVAKPACTVPGRIVHVHYEMPPAKVSTVRLRSAENVIADLLRGCPPASRLKARVECDSFDTRVEWR
jgi:hypothetical protein